jgi:hypothetical protein
MNENILKIFLAATVREKKIKISQPPLTRKASAYLYLLLLGK